MIANADWNITSDINIKALLGSNTRTQYRSSIDASTNGGLGVPKLYTIANSINAPAPPLGILKEEKELKAYLQVELFLIKTLIL